MFGARGQWQYRNVQRDTFSVRDPVIAPAFTLPEESASVWTLFSHDWEGTSDWDVFFATSVDGGDSWSSVHFLGSSSSAFERFPDLRNYTSVGNSYIYGSYISEGTRDRMVYRRYAASVPPHEWSDTLRINEQSAGTGRTIRPLLVYSPGSPEPGPGCVFVGAGLQNLYFNAPWLAGLGEGGTVGSLPGPRALVCRGVFEWQGGEEAEVFDATGRPVATLKPGINDIRHLPAGVYLVADDERERGSRGVGARKFVIAK
jgi:hypothetical protein